ncbi:MAG: zinc-dependent metalloprotease [Bernardetiaceae bacterium]|nr:zinc-dependent metalloprotease [Bernardetiaceae bacterium]
MQAQKLPSIAEKTTNLTAYPGYFNFWWDAANGKIWLQIDKWEQEILYVNSLPAGLGSNDIGLDRAQLGDERVVFFTRVGKKVLMVQPNQRYRALSQDPNERRAVRESFAQSTLWGFVAEAETDGQVLVDATEFLLRDSHKVAERLREAKQGSYRLDVSRSAIYLPRTKNFPQNSEFEATLTWVGGEDAGGYLQSVAPSVEAVTLRAHHSLIQLPDAGYQPRRFDPRSSYISLAYYDYATPVSEPIEKKFIIRHRLAKKDPTAKVSDPVEPIVYYLDNGTPEPIRSALLEGATWWNQAFEAAGYRNAFQVKILPDDADPMDVRYNLINWVHRSTRGWSYGSSVVDPRTGEIIKGHVTLGSLRVRQDYLIFSGLLAPFENNQTPSEPMLKAALHRLKQLSAHEIGHTLGLVHNFAASTNGRASVMDYPHPTIQLDKNGNVDLGNVYGSGIGEWDKVSIAYGYQHFAPGQDEAKELDKIINNANRRGLRFISDQDTRALGGAHPLSHMWDNGADPVAELQNVLAVRQKALAKFGEANVRPGEPLALLEDVLVPVYNYHRYQVEAVAKMVGGLDYNYALRGDGQLVTKLLPAEQQQRAFSSLLACLSPETLTLPERVIQLIPPRPPGFGFTRELFKKRTGLTFDPLAAAEAAADLPLMMLLHVERANRLVEQQARGSNFGLAQVLEQLHTATWKAPRQTGLAAQVQMQTEQIALTHLMALSVNENASYQTRALAQKALRELKTWLEAAKAANPGPDYLAHLELALERLKAPEKAKTPAHKELPPGAPIGMCDSEFCFHSR